MSCSEVLTVAASQTPNQLNAWRTLGSMISQHCSNYEVAATCPYSHVHRLQQLTKSRMPIERGLGMRWDE